MVLLGTPDRAPNTKALPVPVYNMKDWKDLVYNKLVTHEDHSHVHKTLGILVLCSILWRFSLLLRYLDVNLGFTKYPKLTLPTIALHLLLNVSSFQFFLPKIRIKEGTRVWPEFRWHSLIFAARSLAFIGMYHWETNTHTRHYTADLALVLATAAVADVVSMNVQYRAPTIRGLAISNAQRFLYSCIQFYVTTSYLIGVRIYTTSFIALSVIQLTPFFMTLRRKNIVSHHFVIYAYQAAIVGGLPMVVSQLLSHKILNAQILLSSLAIIIRTSPWTRRINNKYVLWCGIWGLAQVLRDYPVTIPRRILANLLVLGTVYTGHVKVKAQNYGTDNK